MGKLIFYSAKFQIVPLKKIGVVMVTADKMADL